VTYEADERVEEARGQRRVHAHVDGGVLHGQAHSLGHVLGHEVKGVEVGDLLKGVKKE
jgi:hypothetical protein